MAGISSKAMSYGEPQNKYKFNGIENNSDFDINIYEAFYRSLDPQTGRFLQVDPVSNVTESPFVMMGNNPVNNTDWLGDYFVYANSTVEGTFNNLRAENGKRLSAYVKEYSALDHNSEDKGVQRKIKQLAGLIAAHNEAASQWDKMDKSDIEFNISSERPSAGADGETVYAGNRVNIRLGASDKNIVNMAHELRHGFGFINGDVVAGGTGLSDMTDEVTAYNAGFLFLDRGTANWLLKGTIMWNGSRRISLTNILN